MQTLVDARALDRTLDYAVPPALDGAAGVGALVACPLGRRRVLGVVVSRDPASHTGRLSSLLGVVDVPPLPAELLELVRWVAAYYRAPAAAAMRLALPPGADGSLVRSADGTWSIRTPTSGETPLVATLGEDEPRTGRQREIAAHLAATTEGIAAAELCRIAGTTMPTLRRMERDGVIRLASGRRSALDWFGHGAQPAVEPPPLTAAQAEAVAELDALVRDGGERLLFGVTGSGKTEVYLRAVEAARAAGRTSIVLVPEISLTPQTLRRVRGRLGDRVAVLHSALTRAERAAEYRRVRGGEVDVVLGARSAIFAPLPRLGLIVVDEEHDGSYKQDASPRYDARRVAIERGRALGAAVVYGSATPRPETWHAIPAIRLPERVDGTPLPRVEAIDMRVQRAGPISRPLEHALREVERRREKAIVLLNRRGFALRALCRDCGWLARCPSCDVALVHHRDPERLACHHCGREMAPPRTCPACGSADLARQGTGTQGLERALREALPSLRLVRMDAGSTAGRGAIDALLAEFARPGAAVLVGTQMVAKGHDLPDVTLAAVVDADAGLQRPDFRAEERTFSLIVQLAGRAGRRGEAARVLVQAYEPGARAVQLALGHAVEEFLDGELERRRRTGFPPFGHLVRLVLEGEDPEPVRAGAEAVGAEIRARFPEIGLLGPAPLHRLRGRWRRALLARARRAAAAADAFEAVVRPRSDALARAGVRWILDVDPQET